MKKAQPVLSAFWSWMEGLTHYDKGSRLGKAIQYAFNRRPYLDTYLEDGRCSLSNNLVETVPLVFQCSADCFYWAVSQISTMVPAAG